MHVRRYLLLAGVWGALALVLPAKAEEKTAEELLKAEGLRKFNQYFVLPGEAAASKKFYEADAIRKKVMDTQKTAAAAEKKVEEKKKLILDYAEKRRLLRAQIESSKSLDVRNRLVNMSNELVDRTTILENSDQEEKDAATAMATAASASEQYIEFLLQLRKQYEQIEDEYDRLSNDAKVRKALDDLSADSAKPFKLGPTGSFALLDRNLKKLEASVLSETIVLRRGGGNLWHVTITFNGKHAQDIAIDTGASIISLPYKAAEAAGLKPSSQNPTIRVGLADGKIVEARQVFASSVRLGKFTIENVECAVMPPELVNAEPLLGLSFLKHFTFKIDNAKGRLVMSKIDQPDQGGRRVAGRSTARDKSGPSRGAEVGGDPSVAKEQPDAAPDATQQLIDVLKEGIDQTQGGFKLQSPGGTAVQFLPSNETKVESLSKRFGEPDEIIRLPVKKTENGEEKSLRWKLWTWGSVRVLVDENGKAQYYTVAAD